MTRVTNIIDVKKYIDNIKVVVFDLDDTLYSEKEYIKCGFKAIGNFLFNVDNVENKLWYYFENKRKPIDCLLIDEGIYSEKLKLKCLDIYRLNQPILHFHDGVLDLFDLLKKSGIKTGIITDGRPEGQKAKIESLGLTTLVDKIIITDELGGIEYRKPCTKAFELMQEYFAVGFNQMCYIGDNLKKDFIAPSKLGMNFIFYCNKTGIYFENH